MTVFEGNNSIWYYFAMLAKKIKSMEIPQFYLEHIPLQHGKVSLLTEYQMVEHLDSYDVPSLP